MCIQDWSTEVFINSMCISYRIFKTIFQIEPYLLKLSPYYSNILCKFRCRNNKLPCNINRFADRSNNANTLCNQCNVLGDEFHFLFNCTKFHIDRCKYIKKYYRIRPSTYKMQELFSNSSIIIMKNLALFCHIIVNSFNQQCNLLYFLCVWL